MSQLKFGRMAEWLRRLTQETSCTQFRTYSSGEIRVGSSPTPLIHQIFLVEMTRLDYILQISGGINPLNLLRHSSWAWTCTEC